MSAAGVKASLGSSYEKLETQDGGEVGRGRKCKVPRSSTGGTSLLAVPVVGADRRRSSATSGISPPGDLDHKQQGKKVTSVIVMTSIASVLGSSFPNGYNTAVLNSPGETIKCFVNSSYTYHNDGDYLESEGGEGCNQEHILYSFVVAAFLLGAIPGAWIAGYVTEKIGRKKSLLINLIFNYVGTILMACSQPAYAYQMLIVGRIIIGFQCGFGMVVCPMYLTECSVVAIRGGIGVLYQLTLTVGILTAQILGVKQVLGDEDTWPWLLAFNAVPATIALALLPFCPESPKYLYFKHHGIEAHKALQKLRGVDNVGYDIRIMRKEREHLGLGKKYGALDIMTSDWHGKALLITVTLNLAQQVTGINAVFFYSDIIYKAAGIPDDNAQYVTIATGVINVLATIVAVKVVDGQGRRRMLLFGQIVMAAATIIITITLSFQEVTTNVVRNETRELTFNLTNMDNTTLPPSLISLGSYNSTNATNITTAYNVTLNVTEEVEVDEPVYNQAACAYLSMICVFFFVIGFAVGLGCIPQFIGSELFRHDARPAAMSIACMANWFGNFIIAISFQTIQEELKSYTFLVFLIILIMVIVFTYKLVPETKNLTIEEIEGILHPDRSYATHMQNEMEMVEMKKLKDNVT